jgi:DNA invertase Pin-like site-specific DNA recombinase
MLHSSQRTTKISASHLQRTAYVYVRQSTPQQVQKNLESQENQKALAQRAVYLGWSPGKVRVIDADLGLSGTSTEGREGFRELTSEVSLGHAGIVFAYEASRLARNNADWYALLDLCTLRGTLIADADGVFDPTDYNDRLLLGLRGMMSEAELHLIRHRMEAGKLRQVEKGEYRQRLPTGLIRLDGGQVVKDPDSHVQRAIELVFERFSSLGSMSKVLHSLLEDEVSLPRFRYLGPHQGELLWCRPTTTNIHGFLSNPAYAGAFVYGRRPMVRDGGSPSGAKNSQRRTVKPMEEWAVIRQDVYPAYIRWEQFLANKQRLRQNGYRLAENKRGAPRSGPALLAGLAVCGHCGRRMSVVYGGSKGHGGYVCTALPSNAGAQSCLYAPRVNADQAVVEAFFEAMRPSELDLLEEALETQSAERQRLLQHHQDNIKTATYEARLAEKRYRAADPENRLVAGELEKGWENALRALEEAEEAAERFERERPRTELDPTLRDQLADLGKRLPQLWEGGRLSMEHKKELLRSLIRHTILSRPRSDSTEIRIVWISGALTTLSVSQPLRRARDLSDYEEMVEKILALTAEGHTDAKIARSLTEEGFRAARSREGIPKNFVRDVRRERGVSSLFETLKGCEKLEGDWTVLGLAKELGVDQNRIYRLIHNGALATERHPKTGRYLVADDPELIAGLQKRFTANERT